MGRGSGYGKVILFGEHMVNYGTPGIVSAIGLTTVAKVHRRSQGSLLIRDDRRGTPGYIEAKRDQQRESISRILDAIDLKTQALEIHLSGSLPVYSGIGASAASCVAITRALSDEFGLVLNDSEVNAVAYEGEIGYHGPTHAGLDNVAATYGGVIWFFRGPPLVHEPVSLTGPCEIVVGNTGIVANTHQLIADVARRKAENPVRYAQIFQEEHTIATSAREALERGDLQAVGKLMDQNHALLQEIGVSCPELDQMVEVARKAGAFGAKNTGGGGGGCMLALTPGTELQERVANAVQAEGFEVLRTVVGAVTPA